MKQFMVLILFCAGIAEAADPNRPVKTEVQTNGYAEFPILKCPATNDVIKDLRKKLSELKKNIKAEAANCKGITADVDKLSKLVTQDRDPFMKLISKGQKEGLNAEDQGQVSKYVEDLTVQTSNLMAVLSGNDGCFDEDKKGASLEFITGLIGEATKVLSVVGGPSVGPTVQIAGEVITGFMKAMKTVQENRQGYKFSDADQRIAYADSLCSLFEYRRELDRVVNPTESIGRLLALQQTINKQLTVLQRNCSECAELIMQVQGREDRVSQETSRDDVNTATIWPADYETNIVKRANEIDKSYTNKVGTHTYRSLKTTTWIPVRIKALADQRIKADLGLEDVLSEMDNVERFMVNDQAPQFVKQLYREAGDWKKRLEQHIYDGQRKAAKFGPLVSYEGWYDDGGHLGIVMESLQVALQRANVREEDKAMIRTYFSDYDRLSRGLNVASEILVNYCEFFSGANWFRNEIKNQCLPYSINQLQRTAMMYTNYKALMPSEKKISAEAAELAMTPPVRQRKVTDWVESLTLVIDGMVTSNRYVERKAGAIISEPF